MADDRAVETPPKPGRGFAKLIFAGIAVLGAALGGLAVYRWVLVPRLLQAASAGAAAQDAEDAIPQDTVAFDFEETQAAVNADDPAKPNSVLMYSVTFICANPQTYALVEKNKQWFEAMLNDLHRNRTRAELHDPQVEKDIRKQALKEANSLLRRLQPKPAPEVEIKIIEVLHRKLAVFDL